MNRLFLTSLFLSIIVSLFATEPATASGIVPDPVPSPHVDKAFVELQEQKRNPKVPSDKYWDRVAWCETHRNWQDGGKWAGGLGIYVPTWIGYGGKEFAPTPSKATRIEQIVIANRIAVHGYQTKRSFKTLQDKLDNKPFFRDPVGFNGWGCIKNYIGAPKPRKVHTAGKNG